MLLYRIVHCVTWLNKTETSLTECYVAAKGHNLSSLIVAFPNYVTRIILDILYTKTTISNNKSMRLIQNKQTLKMYYPKWMSVSYCLAIIIYNRNSRWKTDTTENTHIPFLITNAGPL